MSVGLRSHVNTPIPRVNGLGQQLLIKTARHHTVGYRILFFKISLYVSTPTHACALPHPHPLLTVSDSAMQTKVNFLMWDEVTVLLVFASLLLGLFWGERMTVVTRQVGFSSAGPPAHKEHLVLSDVPRVLTSGDSSEDGCHAGSLKRLSGSCPETLTRGNSGLF